MQSAKKILLSFDVEEFDLPLQYGQHVSNEEQMQTGYRGFEVVMDMVEKFSVEATFFTTANFAEMYSQDIRAVGKKHEIASHTFYHSSFHESDLRRSRLVLENIAGKEVNGLRMPRMQPVSATRLLEAGYRYDSSINPTFLPGRYNNLHLPRTPYWEENLLRFPASVTPRIRVPLFWLAFKNVPYKLYLHWLKQTLQKDGYLCLYFHPWEFVSLSQYKIPNYIKKDSGFVLQKRFCRLLTDLKKMGKWSSMERYLMQRQLLTPATMEKK